MTDRSTGVQQGESAREAAERRRKQVGALDALEAAHEAAETGGWPGTPRRMHAERTLAILEDAGFRVVAVSPEPREGRIICVCCGGGITRTTSPDPWEGRLDDYCEDCAEARCDAFPGECRRSPPDPLRFYRLEGYDKHLEAESGDDKSDITRVLRLTASRLRDPEYHWYEHAAVTLERLAEKLEKGRDDG